MMTDYGDESGTTAISKRQDYPRAGSGISTPSISSRTAAYLSIEVGYSYSDADAGQLGHHYGSDWMSQDVAQTSSDSGKMTIDDAIGRAVAYHQEQRLAEAERLYRAVLNVVPGHPVANFNLGVIAAQNRQETISLRLFWLAYKAEPATPLYLLTYADALLRNNQIGDAEEVLNQATSLGVFGPQADALRNTVQQKRESWLLARSMAGQHLKQARAYLQAGKLTEAQTEVRHALMAAPQNPEAYLLLAECEIAAGAIDLARAAIAQATALAPQSDAATNLLRTLRELESHQGSLSYVGNYLALRARHMDYPANIQLETVGRCNANCSFCPHDRLERKFDEMSDQLFEKIITEAAEIPATSPLNFYLNVVNEPFMDKKIFPRIEMINRMIPHATIAIYSNFNVLPKNFYEDVKRVKNWIGLNISFNAANKSEYEETMRIDFDRTVENIREFLKKNIDHKYVPGPVHLSRIASSDSRDATFLEECKSLFSDFTLGADYLPACKDRANWLGHTEGMQTRIPFSMPCTQWLNMSIFCTGIVPHCCMDSDGDFSFGDLNKSTLLEIYNSPHFRNLRERVLARSAVYPCNSCGLT